MSDWRSTKARKVLAALQRIGRRTGLGPDDI